MKPNFTPEQQGEMDAHRELEMFLKSLLADQDQMAEPAEDDTDEVVEAVKDATDPDEIAGDIEDKLNDEGIDAEVEAITPDEDTSEDDEDFDLEKLRKLLGM